jgi:RimJ/RimL family protein N-acetyltransferase
MILTDLCLEDVGRIRLWRNQDLSGLRTSHPLTEEEQEAFYKNVICNSKSPHRYWAIKIDGEGECLHFIGMAGLTYIQWENRIAEISLIIGGKVKGDSGMSLTISGDWQRKGHGTEAVDLVLERGFKYLGLKTIFGECYYCNPALEFWRKMAAKYNAESTTLPNRKHWDGKHWDSLYFSIDKDEYAAVQRQKKLAFYPEYRKAHWGSKQYESEKAQSALHAPRH